MKRRLWFDRSTRLKATILAHRFWLLQGFRSPVVLAAGVIGIALALSCSKDEVRSGAGAGGHSSGSAGEPAGGTGAGGTGAGGTGTGGTGAGGGATSTGGTTGLDAGGTAGSGAPDAGVRDGGGAGGSATTTCPLPTTFKWTSSGPLAQPKSGWVSLKDFSSVVFNNQHIVYMSTVDSAGSYALATMTFTDWPQMATATQSAVPGVAAPTLMYFTPKNIWVLMY